MRIRTKVEEKIDSNDKSKARQKIKERKVKGEKKVN